MPLPTGFAFTPVCPSGQTDTFHITCSDNSTPVNGRCANGTDATITSTCENIPPQTATYTPTVGMITNIDHVKASSFANPVSSAPVQATLNSSSLFPNYGVIATAATAPLKPVVYGTETAAPNVPTPSFPDTFFSANADCTVDGTACRFIGADFSSNVVNEYSPSNVPYIVDTASSLPSNTGMFVKSGTTNPPTFTSPPGYTKYFLGVLDVNDSTRLDSVQTAETVDACATACNARIPTCTGFNYRLSTRECQLVQGDPSISTTEFNAVSFVREPVPTAATYTTYPAGTNMTHEGNLCSNANICNADLTKLVS